jgi:hypothetical protein
MNTFFVLLGVAVIAYRVFVKGESIIVKNPNWKMRGLAILVVGLSLAALSAYGLIEMYIDTEHHVDHACGWRFRNNVRCSDHEAPISLTVS